GFDDRIDTPEWERWLRGHPPKGGDRRKPWKPLHDPARVWLNADARPQGLPDSAMEATFFADRAAEVFAKHKDRRVARVGAFNEPHSPFNFPDDWPKRYSAEAFSAAPVSAADRAAQPKVFQNLTPDDVKGIQAAYYTSISFVDGKVGRILDALDAS